ARNLTVAPGLIDVHTHGAGGAQAIDGTPESLAKLSAFYARHGVTGFLATIAGANESIERGIGGVVEFLRGETPPGAAILGIHLEGPFINPARPGAFRPETIVPPDSTLLERYLDRAAGHMRLITLAPELDGALDLVRRAAARGIVVSAGHSQATWDEMRRAFDAGLRHATHTFNAMSGLHHRDPGILGAALADDRFTAEIIADGIHVHPAMVRLLVRAKRVERAVLITDSVGAAGLPEGTYHFEEMEITVSAGSARLANGTLAGSVLTMDRGVANLVAFGAASLPEAIAMGSLNPARAIGLGNRKGCVAPGMDADLIALDDDLQVRWTMVGGRMVYHE
ncbi:MAG: N-acetylglucosamine-6-phosphate deacetylase, partial [Chloroflexi bacterium]|nr:N-acetylglucosamine-6-phosphate deacetylase [Chloroflexota bacterium]